MKTLLAVLQLTLVSQVPVQGSETKASTPQPENKQQVRVFDFEAEDTIVLEPLVPEMECFPDRRAPRRSLLRIRDNFDDKVMQSVEEL